MLSRKTRAEGENGSVESGKVIVESFEHSLQRRQHCKQARRGREWNIPVGQEWARAIGQH